MNRNSKLNYFKERWNDEYSHIILTLSDKEIIEIITGCQLMGQALDRAADRILTAGDANVQE